MVNIQVLEAGKGDCIILSFGDELEHKILIDGGIGKKCNKKLLEFYNDLKAKNRKIRLVILTHIDDDHISGILKLFSEKDFDYSTIEEMWYNYGVHLSKVLGNVEVNDSKDILIRYPTTEISHKQGLKLEEILRTTSINFEKIVSVGEVIEISGAKITVLSPTIETLHELDQGRVRESEKTANIASYSDYHHSVEELNSLEFHGNTSTSNRSSISFIFEYCDYTGLFLGDASSEDIETALTHLGYSDDNPLVLNTCKISHHASKHNTSGNLIRLLDCENYIISTKETADGRPSKECLSRIICNNKYSVNFYCNYVISIDKIFTKEEQEKYKMKFLVVAEGGIDLGDIQ